MSNSTKRKILVVNGPTYVSPYRKVAKELDLEFTHNIQDIKDSPESIALVVFTGGHDVSPEVYGESPHPRTSNSLARDTQEIEVFAIAEAEGIAMAGICRGSQFLCVMAGGKLVQDITNHAGPDHDINALMPDGSEETFSVTSSHHQMQYPFNMDDSKYVILGCSTKQRSTHYAMNAETTYSRQQADANLAMEPDIIWYPEISALGAQYHPEWMPKSSRGFTAYEELVDHYLKPLMVVDDTDGTETSQEAS